MRKLSIFSWLAVSLSMVCLDQWSKLWAVSSLSESDMSVFSWLNFALTHNTGAVFGILSDSSGWQRWFFTAFAIVMIAIILNWQSKLRKDEGLESFALALVLGGGVGNVIDRVRLGHVIDFIDVYYKQWHWYTFNVADICICIGATILVLLSLFTRENKNTFA